MQKLKAVSLKTENLNHPIGLDAEHPRFSWKISSERENCYQSAYQILVEDEHGIIVWDTKKVRSDEQYEIIYAGETLKSTTEYRWCVRVWDEQENESDFSEKAVFETGLLQSSDWKGRWIGGNSNMDPLTNLSWIGCEVPPGSTVDFCYTFQVEEPLQQAIFDGTGFESWELSCNGNLWRKMNTEWKQTAESPIRYADLTEWIHLGENRICFRVTSDCNGKAAAIGRLMLCDIYGQETVISTDEHWIVKSDEEEKAAEVWSTYGEKPYGICKRRGVAPLLRKEFQIQEEILRARLYICGLGYASCTINGVPSSDRLLDTEYSQYHKSVYYHTEDVTKMIHPKKKRPVGERLELLARGKVYGEDILCEAPEFCEVEKQKRFGSNLLSPLTAGRTSIAAREFRQTHFQ